MGSQLRERGVGGCRGEGSLLCKARERGVGGVGEKGVCCGKQGREECNVGKEIWERPGV